MLAPKGHPCRFHTCLSTHPLYLLGTSHCHFGEDWTQDQGACDRPFVFLHRHPQASHFPNPTSLERDFATKCAMSGLGGLQPDRGSRGGFWARALPACGCVLSVIDSPASGWLFFFPLALIFILAGALRPFAHPLIQHPGSGSGLLALAALGIIFFLIRNGEETPKTAKGENSRA